jgi:tRNA (guanine26-N2/guanine27-N2)-dimethyltransferase
MLLDECGQNFDRGDRTGYDTDLRLTEEFTSIREGLTTLLVPSESLRTRVPPRVPAFFNPIAKLSRDVSTLVFGSYVRMNRHLFRKVPINFADAFSGVGARAIRVANEIPSVDKVVLNDLNPLALTAAKKSAKINGVEDRCEFSQKDVHVFLNERDFFNKKVRYVIADLDPFGSPSPFVDSLVRAVTDNGLISLTATDTAVLYGKYPNVCFRKYYSRAINCTYSNEIAVRILISFLGLAAGRMDLSIEPIFAHSHHHYSRAYVRVYRNSNEANRLADRLGYISHCFDCGDRKVHPIFPPQSFSCYICDDTTSGNRRSKLGIAGPLWTKPIFSKRLISDILTVESNDGATAKTNKDISNLYESSKNSQYRNIDSGHKPTSSSFIQAQREEYFHQIFQWLRIANMELDNQPFYYTLDEVGSVMNTSPLSMNAVLDRLNLGGFMASRTSFRPTGFKTDATMDDIKELLR